MTLCWLRRSTHRTLLRRAALELTSRHHALVRIRPAHQEDRERTVGMWNETGLVRSWNDPGADFERALTAASSTVLLAGVEGRPVGTVMVGDDGHRGWVY